MEQYRQENTRQKSKSESQKDGRENAVDRFFALGGKWDKACKLPEPYDWNGHTPPPHMYRVMRVSVEYRVGEDNAKMECVIEAFSINELSARFCKYTMGTGLKKYQIMKVTIEEIAKTKEELEGEETCLTNLESLTA